MAIPKIKATYSLDPETVRQLERVSRRWGVSKSEAIRRAIASVASGSEAADPRLAALDRLQAATGLDARSAAAWSRQVRAERRSREPRRRDQ